MTLSNETIERLQQKVEYAESVKYDMDIYNWETEEGCLISYNEAKAILASVKGEEPTPSSTVDLERGRQESSQKGLEELIEWCKDFNKKSLEQAEHFSIRGMHVSQYCSEGMATAYKLAEEKATELLNKS